MINLEKKNDKVYFVKDSIVKVGDHEINFLKEKVLLNNPKSIRLCMHKGIEDPVHEMLIIHSKEAYVRPHKIPNKSTSYHIIEGIADVAIFDEDGVLLEVVALGEFGTELNFFFRLNKSFYYAPIVRSDLLIFHETINGPKNSSDTVYAPWAKVASNAQESEQYKNELISRVDKFLGYNVLKKRNV